MRYAFLVAGAIVAMMVLVSVPMDVDGESSVIQEYNYTPGDTISGLRIYIVTTDYEAEIPGITFVKQIVSNQVFLVASGTFTEAGTYTISSYNGDVEYQNIFNVWVRCTDLELYAPTSLVGTYFNVTATLSPDDVTLMGVTCEFDEGCLKKIFTEVNALVLDTRFKGLVAGTHTVTVTSKDGNATADIDVVVLNILTFQGTPDMGSFTAE